MHEWPLLMFTLLLQGAVGLTLFLSLTPASGRRQNYASRSSADSLKLPVFIVCAMAGLGLLASVFHLGYPLNAFNALRHFSSSWLSREIVFASLFLAAAGLSFLAVWFNKSIGKPLLALALLIGLIDVFCMGQIYMHASVVTWMHANTLVMFYGTAGIVGAVLAVMLLPLHASSLPRWAAGVIALVVVIRLFTQIPYMAWLADASVNDALTFPHEPLTAFRALETLRLWGWGISVIGALLFVTGAIRQRNLWLWLGGVALLVAEIMLRFAFFSIH